MLSKRAEGKTFYKTLEEAVTQGIIENRDYVLHRGDTKGFSLNLYERTQTRSRFKWAADVSFKADFTMGVMLERYPYEDEAGKYVDEQIELLKNLDEKTIMDMITSYDDVFGIKKV